MTEIKQAIEHTAYIIERDAMYIGGIMHIVLIADLGDGDIAAITYRTPHQRLVHEKTAIARMYHEDGRSAGLKISRSVSEGDDVNLTAYLDRNHSAPHRKVYSMMAAAIDAYCQA